MDVWYAAYGSNLLEARFLAYLRGGPVPGSRRNQYGARDATDPVDSKPYRMDRTMLFGQDAPTWGGGVCFVDPHRVVPGDTLGRAWLLTLEQVSDVWAQENGGTIGPDIDIETLIAEGSADLGSGWYRRLEYLGQFEGRPIVTITCEELPEPNAAGAPYLDVVGRGLIETWGLSPSEAAVYLASRTGNRGQVEPEDLERPLRSS